MRRSNQYRLDNTYSLVLGKRKFSKLYYQCCRGGGAVAVDIFLTSAVKFDPDAAR